jgi:putative membrane protein
MINMSFEPSNASDQPANDSFKRGQGDNSPEFKPQTDAIVEASIVLPPTGQTDQAGTPKLDGEELLASVDTDDLSFLHPTSLVFDLLAHGKTYLFPAAFGLWGAAKGDWKWLIISAVIFVPAVLVSVLRYFTYRYCIKDGQLIVKQGLVFRNVRTVPVSRIQNIDFVQNPLHRILKVAEVKIETASGTKPEATLRVLSMHQMESLREAVFSDQPSETKLTGQLSVGSSVPEMAIANSLADPIATGTPYAAPIDAQAASPFGPQVASTVKSEPTTLLQIPLWWLVKAGVASNRGMIMVSVLLGIYFQFGDRRAFFNMGWIQNLWAEDTSWAFIVAATLGGLVAAFFLLRVLSVGWFILRFFGYQLSRRGDDMRIGCGLFTKVSATVPRQRVQFISIHRNLLMRMFRLASIRIETAGGAGKNSENATESVSKRWFIPVVPNDRIPELIRILRPEIDWEESSFDYQPLAAKAARRLCRMAIVHSVILACIGFGVTRPWGWALGLVALPLLWMWAIKKSKSMRYARTNNGVVYRSGVLNHKISMTFFEKIQTLRVDQSPFDRRWGMAALSVDTAAAGPADHRIHIPLLDETFAMQELQVLREKTGNELPVFG